MARTSILHIFSQKFIKITLGSMKRVYFITAIIFCKHEHNYLLSIMDLNYINLNRNK